MMLRPAASAYLARSSITRAIERAGMFLMFADPARRPGSCTAIGTMERAA